MNRFSARLGLISLVLASGSVVVHGQSLTGTLVVHITDAKGAPVGGVRVEMKSEKLQGSRVVVSDASGNVRLPFLPPGDYKGTVVREGFKTSGLQAVVTLGGITELNVSLTPQASASAVVEVIAASSKMAKEQVGVNETFTSETILSDLPVLRTLTGIAILSPGVNTSGTTGNTSPVIAGSMSYENKYLVNGVDVVDNYFNTPNALFIEDAIEETGVITNNVSAEYGRFTGGVINSITKSGGNQFEGSLRATLTQDSWNAVRPLQNRAVISDVMTKVYTATFGGPIIKDKLWFFVAGRSVKSEANGTPLPYSGYSYIQATDQKRYEVKLTWQITPDQTLFASTTNYKQDRTNAPTLLSVGVVPETLRPFRTDENKLYVVGYRALIGSDMNLELRTTQKKQRLAFGRAKGGNAFWNAPTFDINTGYLFNNQYFGDEPEDRDNGSVSAVLGWFFNAAGSHDLKIGAEQFTEKNVSANAQSPVDGGYLINTDVNYTNLNAITYNFTPFVQDAQGNYSGSFLEQYRAIRATFKGEYLSFYINDNWTVNKSLNLTLGLRNDSYKGRTDSGGTPPTFATLQPRLGVNYDPSADGQWQLGAWYAVYMGKMNANIATVTSDTGNPSYFAYGYQGPAAVGVTPSATANGFQRSQYSALPYTASIPTFNVRFRSGIVPPKTVETGLSVKHPIENGYLTLSLTQRSYKDLFEAFQGDSGYIVDPYGSNLPWIEYGNDSSARREYRAATFTFQKRIGKFSLFGNYTYSKLTGNYESDAANSPGGTTARQSFVSARPRLQMNGYLNDDRTHVAKVFGSYNWSWGPHSLVVGSSLLFQSGTPYSLTASTASSGTVYPIPVGTYTGYYSTRGQFRYPDTTFIDFSAEYTWKFFGKASFFTKATIFNVLNNVQLTTFNTTGTVVAGRWTAGPNFAKPTGQSNYDGNRRLQFDAGFRF